MTRVNPWTAAGLAAVLLAACIAGAAVRPAASAGEKAAANKDKDGDVPTDVSKASIEGVVVDEDGKPVAGAMVGVLCPGSDASPTPPPPMAPSAWFSTRPPPAKRSSRRRPTTVRGKASPCSQRRSCRARRHARIVLKPSRKMTVRVTDAAKKPVRDAVVGVLEYTYDVLLADAETDADGVASLRLPRDASVYQVVALKPGSASTTSRTIALRFPPRLAILPPRWT